jgi:hypothetical protein
MGALLDTITDKYDNDAENSGLQLAIVHLELQIVDLMLDHLENEQGDQVEEFLGHANSQGETALLLATRNQLSEVAARLLHLAPKSGELKDRLENAPLHLAVRMGDATTAEMLLTEYANQTSEAEDMRVQLGCFGFHLLLEMDADGMTALDIARSQSDEAMIAIINSFAIPIADAANLSLERFALWQRKRAYVFDIARSLGATQRPVEINERYEFEEWEGVTYYSDEDLRGHTITHVEDVDCGPFYIYVVTTNGELLVGCEQYSMVHHSSLAAGRPVLSAGNLLWREGRIERIDSMSGHYEPRVEHLLRSAHLLYERGLINLETRLYFDSINFGIGYGELLTALA